MEFVTFSQIFSIFLGFWGFATGPIRCSVQVWTPPVRNPLFCPLRNKFLATPLRCSQKYCNIKFNTEIKTYWN